MHKTVLAIMAQQTRRRGTKNYKIKQDVLIVIS